MLFNEIHVGKDVTVGDVHIGTNIGNNRRGRKGRKRPITTVGPGATLTEARDITALAKYDMPAVKAYQIGGIPVEIETPKGHRRLEVTEKGIHHDVTFSQDYGRIPGTIGADGDEVDTYVGDDRESRKAWVINQIDPATGEFDETKVMLGFGKKGQALDAYRQSHSDGRGDARLGEVIKTSYPDLHNWLSAGETTAPYPGGEMAKGWTDEKAAARAERARIDKKMPEGEDGRKLLPFTRGYAKNPLPVHRQALSLIRPDQTPRFLGALTHREKLETRKMKIGDLTAIQDRVDPQKVSAMMAGEVQHRDKPVVLRFSGRNYVLDGNHRLAAKWLSGKETAKVRFLDISPRIEVMKNTWAGTFKVAKTDADKQMIFGWASVSTMGGKLVVDKQGDIIEPHELEDAAYDYVMFSRDQGHMHETRGVGKMIESIMFTKEKQKALGVDLGMEGWWIGFKVTDQDVWKDCKGGKLPEFSIGGVAVPVEA